MRFSIVVPIYNVAQYLPECIDSILSQTFEDYEVILVDDGSKDDSGSICDAYAEKYAHIHVIHQKNSGAAVARNAGITFAIGEYILFLDSDDYIISSEFLQTIDRRIQGTKADIVLYKFQQFQDGQHELQPCQFSFDEAERAENADMLLNLLVSRDAFYASAWTKAIRRRLIVDNNVLFEKGITGEDNEWYLHLLSSCECSIETVDEAFIAYRQRAGSISKAHKLKNLTDYIYVLEKWKRGIAEANISELRKEALYGAMAKYYANLLICYLRVKDKDKIAYKTRVKALHSLLAYSKSKRPMMIKTAYKLLGFDGAVFLLGILDKMK